MKIHPLLAIAAALALASAASAQNTKGTGAETPTTTRTNPAGTTLNAPDPGKGSAKRTPDTPIDPGNPKRTRNAQSFDDPHKSLFAH
jgi:hypothetical protein